MTTAYAPQYDWTHDSLAVQPRLGVGVPLVDGDLCDISLGGRYCLEHAAYAAIDADGGTRILCLVHAHKYFPHCEL